MCARSILSSIQWSGFARGGAVANRDQFHPMLLDKPRQLSNRVRPRGCCRPKSWLWLRSGPGSGTSESRAAATCRRRGSDGSNPFSSSSESVSPVDSGAAREKSRPFAALCAFAPGAIVADVARRASVCAGQIYRWRQELGHAGSGFSRVVIAAMDDGGNDRASPRRRLPPPGGGGRGAPQTATRQNPR